MKTFNLLFLFLLLFSAKCEDDDRPTNPIDQLPPLTMTGENTFGCLIDGRVFKPQGGGLGGPSRGASFQFISNNGDPYYQFQVFGDNNNSDERVSINLFLPMQINLKEESPFLLSIREQGGVGNYDNSGQFLYKTNEVNIGSMNILHYDEENRIVSGTFEFKVEVDGKIVKITDGRFDMNFTI